MKKPVIDRDYLLDTLRTLLEIPSPSGYTDNVVHTVCEMLSELKINHHLTRRGGIRATLEKHNDNPGRALVAHLDTLGAMVSRLKANGRLEIVPIGTWSSRFAEGARVTVQSEHSAYRGTVLPLKASGHTFGDEIDSQPVNWQQIEVRLDEKCEDGRDLEKLGLHIGDYISFDTGFELTDTDFINSRHLDDKAGVAVMLAAAHAIQQNGFELPVDSHLLFTISEEVGSGASSILHGNIAEMVAIDNATNATTQNSSPYGVTLAMLDSSGPFDYHLTHQLIKICQEFEITHTRDVFRHYRCDAASAVEAGNDIRTALACFAVDGSHGYERTHVDSLIALAELIVLYLQSEPAVARDRVELGSIKGFPDLPQ